MRGIIIIAVPARRWWVMADADAVGEKSTVLLFVMSVVVVAVMVV